MPVDVGGTVISSDDGTTITARDSSNNVLFKQDSQGRVFDATTSGGTSLLPKFHVGYSSSGWVTMAAGDMVMAYTSGSGYVNIGGCYNTSNGRFTAPFTGIYYFYMSYYAYGNNSTYGWWHRPQFYVNGSRSTRRLQGGPLRMRLYGIPASYGFDGDANELIYLTAGDYVTARLEKSGTIQIYQQYTAWGGAYLGSIS